MCNRDEFPRLSDTLLRCRHPREIRHVAAVPFGDIASGIEGKQRSACHLEPLFPDLAVANQPAARERRSPRNNSSKPTTSYSSSGCGSPEMSRLANLPPVTLHGRFSWNSPTWSPHDQREHRQATLRTNPSHWPPSSEATPAAQCPSPIPDQASTRQRFPSKAKTLRSSTATHLPCTEFLEDRPAASDQCDMRQIDRY